MDNRIHQRLKTVRSRLQTVRFLFLTGLFWLLAAIVATWMWWEHRIPVGNRSTTSYSFLACAAVLLLAAYLMTRRSYRDNHELAKKIEARFPELDQRLITIIDETPGPDGRFGFLQESVIQQVIGHDRQASWSKLVSPNAILGSWTLLLIGTSALSSAFVLSGIASPKPIAHIPPPEFAKPPQLAEVKVDPGDTEIEKGTGLLVTARFPQDVPGNVRLIASTADGDTTVAMSRTLDEPLFAAHLPEVDSDMRYRVEFDNGKTPDYRVRVFEFPKLVRADVSLDFPDYTQLPDRTIEDTVRITVVEGTETHWKLRLNKPVQRAQLISDRETIELTTNDSRDVVSLDRKMIASSQWKLRLVDQEGRENKRPPSIRVSVVPNRRPDLKMVSARDVRVSPLEELDLAAKVSDDFGVAKFGISVALADTEMQDIVLAENAKAKSETQVRHRIDFEALAAKPDQLLAYNFWAEDFGPDGELRRTAGDLFFAEVRHFEEIFRQGQQSSAQSQQQQQNQSQNGQQAEQLAELQKQIMNATWRIVRRESPDSVSDAFDSDLALLADSQQTALTQLLEMSKRINDGDSIDFVSTIQSDMLKSLEQLQLARSKSRPQPLDEALTHQRLAYQGLLRLRSREHEVVQSQQQNARGSSSQSRQQFQQQLEQLQLKNDQNRYETERQAQQQEDQAQKEVRQVLNRLRELARRQQDINRQVKDLQAALRIAENEERRKELERQLKRLREQQEEMLRDIDELQHRMQEARNQQAMQPSQQQVERSRQNAQRASEALQRNDPSSALTAGTRAERDLKEVRDRLRAETANQFEDAMRRMRMQAQELEQRQERISSDLQRSPPPNDRQAPRLRNTENNSTSQQTEAIEDQQRQLADLLQEMEQTINEAETSEPLLSQKLYDALRDTYRRRIPEDLEAMEELVKRGMTQQAQTLADSLEEGVQRLRQDIDQAAESVLGDDTEGLRRALSELDEIARQLDSEIERNDGPPKARASDANESDQPSPADNDLRDTAEGPRRSDPQADDRSTRQAGGLPDADPHQGAQSNPGRESTENPNSPRELANNDSPDRVDSSQAESPSQDAAQGQTTQPSDPNPNSSNRSNEESQSPDTNDQQDANRPPSEQTSNGSSSSSVNRNSEDARSDSPSRRSNSEPANRSESQSASSGTANSAGNRSNQRRPSLRDIGQPESEGGSPTGGGLQMFRDSAEQFSPLTGDDFREWSDRLRDVEEMIEDPDLRAEAARIRDRARGIRREFIRHSKEPKWDLVRELVAIPLQQLRTEVSAELLRRSAKRNEVVPIDRDPVPSRFSRQVEKYYEQLGAGR